SATAAIRVPAQTFSGTRRHADADGPGLASMQRVLRVLALQERLPVNPVQCHARTNAGCGERGSAERRLRNCAGRRASELRVCGGRDLRHDGNGAACIYSCA
ncbi:MAG TPA: hypothetical protein PLC02_00290, partial [Pseudomonadota bacterium]|nr:hypothetical protein [Pseudomonadota bacterium]